MFSGLQPPTVILRDPWLAELYGAGFTKAPKSKVSRVSTVTVTISLD